MIVVCCHNCMLALRVIGEPLEVHSLVGQNSDFWPNKYTCPRCLFTSAVGCVESALSGDQLNEFELMDLSAHELFAALNGLGLPDEQECSLETVTALLKEHHVKRVVGADVLQTSRCVLFMLELANGTRLHFGSGPEGAVIYRNVPPQSYAEKIRG